MPFGSNTQLVTRASSVSAPYATRRKHQKRRQAPYTRFSPASITTNIKKPTKTQPAHQQNQENPTAALPRSFPCPKPPTLLELVKSFLENQEVDDKVIPVTDSEYRSFLLELDDPHTLSIEDSESLRYDYDPQSSVLTLRCMPSPVHDNVQRSAQTMRDQMARTNFIPASDLDYINVNSTTNVSLPSRIERFPSNARRGERRAASKQPDACYGYDNPEKLGAFPRVVFEVSFKRSYETAVKAAEQWLVRTMGKVKLVIVINLEEGKPDTPLGVKIEDKGNDGDDEAAGDLDERLEARTEEEKADEDDEEATEKLDSRLEAKTEEERGGGDDKATEYLDSRLEAKTGDGDGDGDDEAAGDLRSTFDDSEDPSVRSMGVGGDVYYSDAENLGGEIPPMKSSQTIAREESSRDTSSEAQSSEAYESAAEEKQVESNSKSHRDELESPAGYSGLTGQQYHGSGSDGEIEERPIQIKNEFLTGLGDFNDSSSSLSSCSSSSQQSYSSQSSVSSEVAYYPRFLRKKAYSDWVGPISGFIKLYRYNKEDDKMYMDGKRIDLFPESEFSLDDAPQIKITDILPIRSRNPKSYKMPLERFRETMDQIAIPRLALLRKSRHLPLRRSTHQDVNRERKGQKRKFDERNDSKSDGSDTEDNTSSRKYKLRRRQKIDYNDRLVQSREDL